jgi:hypothetical protein
VSYLGTQTAAARLLADKGQAVTLTVSTPGPYANGAVTLTETTVQTTGVVLPLSRGLKHMPGTDIVAGDQQLLLPGDIAQPSLDTKATIGGVDYTVVEVAPLDPGGTALLYDCVIRGAQ